MIQGTLQNQCVFVLNWQQRITAVKDVADVLQYIEMYGRGFQFSQNCEEIFLKNLGEQVIRLQLNVWSDL